MNSNAEGFLSRIFRQRAGDAGERIVERTSSVRSLAEQLRHDDLTRSAGDAIDSLATKAESFGKYLIDTDLDTFVKDAERFGRKQPFIVAIGGLIVGYGASRIRKAGMLRRHAEAA